MMDLSLGPRDFAGLHGRLEGPVVRSLQEMCEDPDEKMLAAVSDVSGSATIGSADLELQDVQTNVRTVFVPDANTALGCRPVDAGELAHGRLDELEAAILDNLEPVHMPVIHRFVPGLYLREICMPAGTVLTSRVHETEHPYVVLSGVAQVSIPGQEPVELRAGHVGITKPGTRRALLILEECRWITFHPLSAAEERLRASGASDAQILACIEERIIGKREREDGRDVFAEYKERLAAKGLPGPHDGARALEGE